ncbi:hypothetical protein GCM10008986_28720 [Salinibacillus aidingensis]|uniref:Uncharacterized protein n=1 Tax=Salinibacillus aidingensis TaxID=237684 RepID=A0ABP3LG31_9BACI
MLYSVLVVLASLILGFILYQVPLVQSILDISGMFQIANFIMLVVILYLLLEKRSE